MQFFKPVVVIAAVLAGVVSARDPACGCISTCMAYSGQSIGGSGMTVSWYGVHNNMPNQGGVELYKLDNALLTATMDNNAIVAIHYDGKVVKNIRKKKKTKTVPLVVTKDAQSVCANTDQEILLDLYIPVKDTIEHLSISASCVVVGDKKWFANVQITREVGSDKATFAPYPMDGLCSFESFLEPLPKRSLRTARNLLSNPPHVRSDNRNLQDCSWEPVCACSARCTARGDPHVYDFRGNDEWIMAQDTTILLYKKGEFEINAYSATQWAYIKKLYWGEDVIDADKVCSKRRQVLEMSHVFDDGNVLELSAKCETKKAGKKNPRDSDGYYFDVSITKHNNVKITSGFFEAESEQDTVGLCLNVDVI